MHVAAEAAIDFGNFCSEQPHLFQEAKDLQLTALASVRAYLPRDHDAGKAHGKVELASVLE